MNRALGGVLVLWCLLLASACGGDDEGAEASVSAACREGCVATVAAGCDNGPGTQADCESDCQALESGACGTEYAALQSCADGKAVTCNSQGLPTIAGCASETAAFVSCL